MAIKSFDEYWKKYEARFVTENIDPVVAEALFNAGVKAAKVHYEEEAIATMEYYDAILRKTNTTKLNDVPSPPQSKKEREVVRKLLAGEFA